jgi:hypothetical protein
VSGECGGGRESERKSSRKRGGKRKKEERIEKKIRKSARGGKGKWSKRGLWKLIFGQNRRRRLVTIDWKKWKNVKKDKNSTNKNENTI